VPGSVASGRNAALDAVQAAEVAYDEDGLRWVLCMSCATGAIATGLENREPRTWPCKWQPHSSGLQNSWYVLPHGPQCTSPAWMPEVAAQKLGIAWHRSCTPSVQQPPSPATPAMLLLCCVLQGGVEQWALSCCPGCSCRLEAADTG
jgi:hypothetical protein